MFYVSYNLPVKRSTNSSKKSPLACMFLIGLCLSFYYCNHCLCLNPCLCLCFYNEFLALSIYFLLQLLACFVVETITITTEWSRSVTGSAKLGTYLVPHQRTLRHAVPQLILFTITFQLENANIKNKSKAILP
jgi:hypothetical protein